MKKYDRISRVNELLKQEIAGLIEKYMEHKEGCLVSVSEVVTSHDLQHAKVYVSTIGPEVSKREIMKFLMSNRVFMQHEISHNVKMKYTPVLEFVFDNRIEAGDRVLSIIKDMEKDPENLTPDRS